jgi:hypothetical protein
MRLVEERRPGSEKVPKHVGQGFSPADIESGM